MAGIYLHIPFCKSRCIYCDFFTGTDEAKLPLLVEALNKELIQRQEEIGDERVDTIYFGGGTPSRLSRKDFESVFKTIYDNFDIANNAEITVESNPDDLNTEYIHQLTTSLPFNRISVGVQSFVDDELKFLKRRHSASQAMDVVRRCQDAGLTNISIDLMYGLPGQTLDSWQYSLDIATSLDVTHISAYHLIYEEKTKLYHLLERGKVAPLHEDLSLSMFARLIDHLGEKGYKHYEISNFAKEGFISRHNSSYWHGDKYLGIGPSAHSYDGNNRSSNLSSLDGYIQGVNDNSSTYREYEELSLVSKYNDYIITGLRTSDGIDLPSLRIEFGDELYDYCISNANKHLSNNLLSIVDNRIILTREGIFISDGIMSDLMKV